MAFNYRGLLDTHQPIVHVQHGLYTQSGTESLQLQLLEKQNVQALKYHVLIVATCSLLTISSNSFLASGLLGSSK